jgi:hypothetical protein
MVIIRFVAVGSYAILQWKSWTRWRSGHGRRYEMGKMVDGWLTTLLKS